MRIKPMFAMLLAAVLVFSLTLSACSSSRFQTAGPDKDRQRAAKTPDVNDNNTLEPTDKPSDPPEKATETPQPEVVDHRLSYDQLSSEQKEQVETIKGTLQNNVPYYIEITHKQSFTGDFVYDLNNDSQYEVIHVNAPYEESGMTVEITINGSTLPVKISSYYEDGYRGFGIMDADVSDDSVELFIGYNELSDRRENVLINYSQDEAGSRMDQFGMVDGAILGCSGDGKLYYWGGNFYEPSFGDVFDPNLVISYYDVKLMDYVDTDQIVGKTITSDRHFIVYANKDDVLRGAPIYEEENEDSKKKHLATIEPGDTFTVKSIRDDYDLASIETADGQIGYVGGFHMVWD